MPPERGLAPPEGATSNPIGPEDPLQALLKETIQSRSTVQRALDAQVRKYGDLTARAPFGVLHVDSGCRYDEANPALLAIFGVSFEDWRDREVGTCDEPPAWIHVLRAFHRQIGAHEAQHTIAVTIGDEVRHLEISLGREAEGAQFAAFVADRTPQARALQDARRYAEEAREANRAKSDFLAVMSHELRTPLNGVLGMASILEDTGLDDAQVEILETIRGSAGGLLTIINEILDFSKLESGTIRPESIPFRLRDVLDAVVDVARARMREQGIAFHLELGPSLPTWLVGDPNRLRQVLVNLVGNAVKFTREGHVALRVRPAEGRPGRIHFAVRDTGIGIAPEAISKIFESFVQAERSTARRYGGTGLGLSISRGLVEAMQGCLEVESTVGEGTTFSFDLPLPPQAEREAEAPLGSPISIDLEGPQATTLRSLLGQLGCDEALPRARPGLSIGRDPEEGGLRLSNGLRSVPLSEPLTHHTLERAIQRVMEPEEKPVETREGGSSKTPCLDLDVLLVEDNEANRRIACHFLRRLGCRVTFAVDGQEGVAEARARRFDAILMDVEMPGLDGLGATRQIRALEGEAASVPIIALTANATCGDDQRCLAAGMDAYQAKPYTFEQLTLVLVRTLGLSV